MKTLTIWRLLDGKPGHESQTLGLVNSLRRLVPVRCENISVGESAPSAIDWLLKRFQLGLSKPAPDLIIGAGHSTHWALICAKRAYGGQTIVMMKPSLPLSWFDWVVVPKHDGACIATNVIATQGVLNAMRPGPKCQDEVLVLVGGIGKHFIWNDADVMRQISVILSAFPRALITDSRRTPTEMRQQLTSRYEANYHPWDTCPIGWLSEKLATAARVWVTEDSVSMIYEALTAGCAVGLLVLKRPSSESGRLVKGIEMLVQAEQVVRFDDWRAGQGVLPKPSILCEADRVAHAVLAALDKKNNE
jgi:mitochondrial fission protein ELM1